MSSGNLPGVSVKDVDQQKFVRALAAFFKKGGKIKMIENADIIKTASYKEMAPEDIDWFYTRVAAVARHLYIRSPCGVGALKRMYGGRQNNGTTPSHFKQSSGTIARKALQALEGLKMVEKDPNGGRKLTSAGRRDLDRIATQLKANKQ